jgi:hypothetical protein
VDWKEGNDKMYTTLIPIQVEDVEALKGTDIFGLIFRVCKWKEVKPAVVIPDARSWAPTMRLRRTGKPMNEVAASCGQDWISA